MSSTTSFTFQTITAFTAGVLGVAVGVGIAERPQPAAVASSAHKPVDSAHCAELPTVQPPPVEPTGPASLAEALAAVVATIEPADECEAVLLGFLADGHAVVDRGRPELMRRIAEGLGEWRNEWLLAGLDSCTLVRERARRTGCSPRCGTVDSPPVVAALATDSGVRAVAELRWAIHALSMYAESVAEHEVCEATRRNCVDVRPVAPIPSWP